MSEVAVVSSKNQNKNEYTEGPNNMFWTCRLGRLSESEAVGFGCLRWQESVIKINEYKMNIPMASNDMFLMCR